jgi:hypothetical protein
MFVLSNSTDILYTAPDCQASRTCTLRRTTSTVMHSWIEFGMELLMYKDEV